MYTYELRYMVDGCGKKIPSTRTVVIFEDGKEIAEIKTQEDPREILMIYEGSNRET